MGSPSHVSDHRGRQSNFSRPSSLYSSSVSSLKIINGSPFHDSIELSFACHQ